MIQLAGIVFAGVLASGAVWGGLSWLKAVERDRAALVAAEIENAALKAEQALVRRRIELVEEFTDLKMELVERTSDEIRAIERQSRVQITTERVSDKAQTVEGREVLARAARMRNRQLNESFKKLSDWTGLYPDPAI